MQSCAFSCHKNLSHLSIDPWYYWKLGIPAGGTTHLSNYWYHGIIGKVGQFCAFLSHMVRSITLSPRSYYADPPHSQLASGAVPTLCRFVPDWDHPSHLTLQFWRRTLLFSLLSRERLSQTVCRYAGKPCCRNGISEEVAEPVFCKRLIVSKIAIHHTVGR